MSNIPILPLFFFSLLSFPAKPLSLRAASPDSAVLDTSGKELLPGVPYQILPATGGTFTLSGYQNDTCPLVVVHVQQKTDSLKFPPVTFSPANPGARVIQTSTNLNFKFSITSSAKPCGSSMVWRLLKRISEARFISTDGVEGNPNMNTFVNWFMIEKLSSDKSGSPYKLRFCPTDVCKCSVTCSDLGIYVADDKKRYLGLADKLEPISVVFKRAS
ncbi:kunitz trypsin inhibitor 5-like [Prosopis cineraria]|uniref:kunitz trypsin inhibitor 5-like n=1 Tax=Prosopis cineraria TaxID=364024 RepID=UPI00240ED57A|nr:kunitz trypsin inhibitor 5-like [Prosopis cineraria]